MTMNHDDWKLDSEGFHLYKPHQLRPWYNYISNAEYGIKLSHMGSGYGATLDEPRTMSTHFDPVNHTKGRYIYVKDGSELWAPTQWPLSTKVDEFECIHSPGWSGFKSSKNDIQVSSKHFVPQSGRFEFWHIEAKNTGSTTKSIELFPQVELLLYPDYKVHHDYYSWFTNSKFKDNCITVGKDEEGAVDGFVYNLKDSDSWQANLQSFWGDGSFSQPEEIFNEALGQNFSAGDPYGAVFQHKITLEPGESFKTCLVIGIGSEQLEIVKQNFSTVEDVEAELAAVKSTWQSNLSHPKLPETGNEEVDAYLNTFFGYQIYQQAAGLVREGFRGVRDVGQDVMGLSYYEPELAKEIFLDLCSKQFPNGRCLRQWNVAGGFDDDRDFRDLPLWLILAAEHLVRVTGDNEFLLTEVEWLAADGVTAPVIDHLVQGLQYMLQYGPDDCIIIGVGDWNDALNGLGLQGQSVWLNQFAYMALDKLAFLYDRIDVKCPIDIEAEQLRLFNGVQNQWTGEWFGRGITEDGEIVGGEDRIFLLPQAWYTLSGMALRDPEKGKIALNSMVSKLRNDNGLLLCYPPFDVPTKSVGRLSFLAPGVAENFAIYNHAAAYGILALFEADMDEEGREFMAKALPFTKDWRKTRAEPFVLVNYYNGGYYDFKDGEGGIPWLTSTISWLAITLFDVAIPKGKKFL